MSGKGRKKTGRVRALEGLGGELSRGFRANIKPTAILSAVFAAVFALALILTKSRGSTPVFAYILLYISLFSFFVSAAAVPAYSIYSAILRGERYDVDERKKLRRLSPSAVALGKFIPAAVTLVYATALRTISDYALTVTANLTYDGYVPIMLAVSAALFGVALYVTSLIIASILKYKAGGRRASRGVIADVLILYTIGLFVLALVFFALSGISLGSYAIEDLTDAGLSAETAPLLGGVYLGACVIRVIYLFIVAKRRIYRTFFVKQRDL